jgi:hypothetical protein
MASRRNSFDVEVASGSADKGERERISYYTRWRASRASLKGEFSGTGMRAIGWLKEWGYWPKRREKVTFHGRGPE